MPSTRTLWEQGRTPGRLVVAGAITAVLLAVAVDSMLTGGLALLFDTVFVLTCLVGALAVAGGDFFAMGVLPPLLMAGAMGGVAALDRDVIGDRGDTFVQAVIAGLADHATALMLGYALALVVLALRQFALRHHGRLRRS
ncbi:MAG: hypothetical protein QM655_11445 [Nocardioidaceae bacterium]